MNLIICSVLVLGIIGFAGALMLYATARRFHVDEDPRIDRIASVLPGANCGGCGLKGCRDFATRCVEQGSLKGLHCPVSSAENTSAIASILGVTAETAVRRIAVLHCNGLVSGTSGNIRLRRSPDMRHNGCNRRRHPWMFIRMPRLRRLRGSVQIRSHFNRPRDKAPCCRHRQMHCLWRMRKRMSSAHN